MAIKLYGPKVSSAFRCHWLLDEIGLDYQEISLNLKADEHKTEEFKALNPNSQVPVLVDEEKGVVLHESMAINFYLAREYKPELLGKNAKDEALVLQWSFWSILNLQPPLYDIVIELNRGNEGSDLIQQSVARSAKYLEILNNYLSDKEYILGRNFSLADINVGSVVQIAKMIKIEHVENYPNILTWLASLSAMASMQTAISDR